jgi:hypothetical protein
MVTGFCIAELTSGLAADLYTIVQNEQMQSRKHVKNFNARVLSLAAFLIFVTKLKKRYII